MFTTYLDLGETVPDVRLIRWELPLFRDVHGVLPATREGTIVVIHTCAARCEARLAELHGAGLLPDPDPLRAQD